MSVFIQKFIKSRKFQQLLILTLLGFITTVIARDYAGFAPDVTNLKMVHEDLSNFEGNLPNQYRLLSFLIPDILIHTGFNISSAYFIVHFIVISLAFWIFFQTISQINSLGFHYEPLLATLILALIYIFGMEPVEQPADCWEFLGCTFLLYCLSRKNSYILLLSLTFIYASFSKESLYFYFPVVIYKAFYHTSIKRGVLNTLLIFSPGIAVAITLRILIHADGSLSNEFISSILIISSIFRDIPYLLAKGNPFSSTSRFGNLHFFLVFAPIVWAYLRWRSSEFNSLQKWIIFSLPLPIALNLLFGYLTEFRIFVASFVFFIPLALAHIFSNTKPENASFQLSGKKLILLLITVALLWGISFYILPTNGLHYPESDGQLNFHWFDRKATVKITSIDPNIKYGIPLKISGYPLVSGETRQLKVSLIDSQDQIVSSATTNVGSNWSVFHIPKNWPVSKAKRVKFETAFYFTPAAMPGLSPDRRLLSMQLGNLTSLEKLSGLTLQNGSKLRISIEP